MKRFHVWRGLKTAQIAGTSVGAHYSEKEAIEDAAQRAHRDQQGRFEVWKSIGKGRVMVFETSKPNQQ